MRFILMISRELQPLYAVFPVGVVAGTRYPESMMSHVRR